MYLLGEQDNKMCVCVCVCVSLPLLPLACLVGDTSFPAISPN